MAAASSSNSVNKFAQIPDDWNAWFIKNFTLAPFPQSDTMTRNNYASSCLIETDKIWPFDVSVSITSEIRGFGIFHKTSMPDWGHKTCLKMTSVGISFSSLKADYDIESLQTQISSSLVAILNEAIQMISLRFADAEDQLLGVRLYRFDNKNTFTIEFWLHSKASSQTKDRVQSFCFSTVKEYTKSHGRQFATKYFASTKPKY